VNELVEDFAGSEALKRGVRDALELFHVKEKEERLRRALAVQKVFEDSATLRMLQHVANHLARAAPGWREGRLETAQRRLLQAVQG
jgi:hypothetical protein